VLIGWTTYQTVAVPQQAKTAEINHNEDVQDQLIALRDGIVRTGTGGSSQSTRIQLAAEYPQRILTVNLGVTAGAIRTNTPDGTPSANITLKNINATRKDVSDYFQTTGSQQLNFSTKDIVYTPAYTYYNNPPATTISNGVGFNQFEDANLSISSQPLINNNRITLVALDGNLSESRSGQGASVSVATEPLSVAENTISVTNANGPINITLPTTVANKNAWLNETGLADESAVDSVEITGGGDYVSLTLKNDTYSLRMLHVGVGEDTTEPGKQYIVPNRLPSSTVSDNETYEATVEVRDRFNNPVGGVPVDTTTTAGSITASDGTESGADGQITFEWSAPDVNQRTTATLAFNISDNGRPAQKIVEKQVTVLNAAGGGAGGDGAGSGGMTDYANEQEQTFSTKNGLWTNITTTDQMVLSGARPKRDPGDNRNKMDLIGVINNSAGDTYEIDITLHNKTQDWAIKTVAITKITDSDVNTRTGTLRTDAADRIFNDGETDILDEANYNDPGSFSEYLDKVRRLDDRPPIEWQTSEIVGRVDVEFRED